MALIHCPHCGQTVSDSATQCPHCQRQLVTKYQRSRTKTSSLFAMLLCIVGIILILVVITIPFGNSISPYGTIRRMSFPTFVAWLLVSVAWLIWFVGGERQRYTAVKIGIMICLLIVIANVIDFHLYGLYAPSFVAQKVLPITFGVTLFFLRRQGIINTLTKTAGILYVIYPLVDFVIGDVTRIPYLWGVIIVSICLLVTTAALFYCMYKKAKQE